MEHVFLQVRQNASVNATRTSRRKPLSAETMVTSSIVFNSRSFNCETAASRYKHR
jgi:hypothetical protein